MNKYVKKNVAKVMNMFNIIVVILLYFQMHSS